MLRVGVVMYQTSLTKGQELVAQRMVKELRELNYDAFLISSPYHDGEPVISDEELSMHAGYAYIFDETLDIPVIRVGSVPTTWPPRRASLVDFIDTLGKIVDNFKLNVLITHSTLWNGPEEILKFIEWRRNMSRDGVPKLTPIFCHMSHFQEASADRYGIMERSYREAWNQTSLSMIVREADLILVVSPFEKELMRQRGADEAKCMLFPGGIEDLTGLVGDPGSLRARLGVAQGVALVTALGTVEERKNTLNVVKVAEKLQARKDIHFVIAGMEQGEYGATVRREATGKSNVSVLGPISDFDKSALIQASAVNIIMSRSEALGITQLEFMTNGIPVVSSGAGGQQWVVNNGVNGITVDGPDDIEGAAKAVERLVVDPQLRKKMGKEARRSAAKFSMAVLTDALAKRLENIARSRSDDERLRKSMSGDEQAIEAMVAGGLKVIVTNKRLLVKDDRKGAETTSIPIENISKIAPQRKLPWGIFAAGVAADGVLSFVVLMPPVHSFFAGLVPDYAVSWFVGAVPIAPLVLASAAFALRIKSGFAITSKSGTVFLPRQFARLIKLVNRLVPGELLEESGAPVFVPPQEESEREIVSRLESSVSP